MKGGAWKAGALGELRLTRFGIYDGQMALVTDLDHLLSLVCGNWWQSK